MIYAGHNIKCHDDVIKWKHFPCYWTCVRDIHRVLANSPHKGQWRGALMFSLICAWIKGWINNGEAVDFRRHRFHYDVTLIWNLFNIFISYRLPKTTKGVQYTIIAIASSYYISGSETAAGGGICPKLHRLNMASWFGYVLMYASGMFMCSFTGIVITYPCWD